MASRKKNKSFIVKVQLPLFASDSKAAKEVLIYNEDRSVQQMFAVSKGLLKMMKGEPKAYFYAESINGFLHLVKPAPWQNW